jgi:hypothetical protein
VFPVSAYPAEPAPPLSKEGQPSTSKKIVDESISSEDEYSNEEQVASGPAVRRSSTISTLELNFKAGKGLWWPHQDGIMRLLGEPFLARSPKSGNEHRVPSLLSFHRQKISAGHYYRDDDAQRFCTQGVLQMAQRSLPMQYAVASFASIVYSVEIDRRVRPLAFVYYSEAVRRLQPLLDQITVNSDEWPIVLAAVLQLGAVEVDTFLQSR